MVSIPNKEVALIPNKEVAKVANKELANVASKEVAIIPNDGTKQMANLPIKEIATIPAKHVALSGLRLHESCMSCNLMKLPKSIKQYVEEKAKLCQPDSIYICDGSEEENAVLLKILEDSGRIQKLDKMKNW